MLAAMMSKTELASALRTLRLSAKEAGALLSVDPKTVARWLAGDVDVSGPAEQALRAWLRLESRRIPWRPDGLPLSIMSAEEIEEQNRLMREEVVVLDQVIELVQQRGGPAAPWRVDLARCEAELAGTMYVHFYRLPNGGFTPSSYRRTDKEPDYERDLPLIQDAIACIAEAVAAERKVGRNRVAGR
jgi:hypothetical protein